MTMNYQTWLGIVAYTCVTLVVFGFLVGGDDHPGKPKTWVIFLMSAVWPMTLLVMIGMSLHEEKK